MSSKNQPKTNHWNVPFRHSDLESWSLFLEKKSTMTGWKIQHECMSRCIYFLLKNGGFFQPRHVSLIAMMHHFSRTVTARCAGSDCESQLSQQPGRNDEEKNQISLES